jgi:hypothetical protein
MSKMMTRSVLAAAVLGLASLAPPPARAGLINVQFNTSRHGSSIWRSSTA